MLPVSDALGVLISATVGVDVVNILDWCFHRFLLLVRP
jgi:hypothetical protein